MSDDLEELVPVPLGTLDSLSKLLALLQNHHTAVDIADSTRRDLSKPQKSALTGHVTAALADVEAIIGNHLRVKRALEDGGE